MKKIIGLILAVAFLVVGGVFNYESDPVSAGKNGWGTGATVSTAEEFVTLLSSISNSSVAESTAEGVLAEPLGYSSADGEAYTSFTLSETTYYFASSSYSSSSSTAEANRDLKWYFSGDAAYYQSTLRALSLSSSGKYTRKTTVDIELKLYLSAERVLFRLEKFEITGTYSDGEDTTNLYDDDTYQEFQSCVGQWVDCTNVSELAEELLDLNEMNLDTLATLDDVLERWLDGSSGYLKQSGDIYQLTEDGLMYFFGLSSYKDDLSLSGSGSFDLSNAAKPTVSFDVTASYSVQSSDVSRSAGVCMQDELVLSNLNCTAVSLGNVKAADAEELFGL